MEAYRQIAIAELFGDQRAGNRRAFATVASVGLGNCTAHQPELPDLFGQLGWNLCTFVGKTRRRTDFLARKRADGVADHLLFFAQLEVDHALGSLAEK